MKNTETWYFNRFALDLPREAGATLGALIEKHGKAQKVFIPDNQGGGTWETWKDDRHENGEHCPSCFNAGYDSGVISLKASAEKLAEALRGILAAYKAVREKPLRIVTLVDNAESALARWEGQ